MENFCFNISSSLKANLALVSGIFFLLLIAGCNAIFETDIRQETVTMIIPTANDTILSNQVHFKWNPVKGADFYNLQVVDPSFASINDFMLDSNITGEEFYLVLSPGGYEFKIRAENSAYQSEYSGPFSFYVDSVSDLSAQIVALIAPADNYYSNADNFTYSWQPVYSADNYEFQLRSGLDFDASTTILQVTSGIYSTSYTTPEGLFPTEGSYSWGVKAVNSTSSSAFSSRTILIDLTAPNDAVLLSPATGASFADTVTFQWDSGSDPGTIHAPVSAHVEIATDSLFGSVIQTYDVSGDTVQHVFTSLGTYWWRVYLFDEAGNSSANYSEQRKVLIP